MPRIRLLPPEVASGIAAGEVIERPASLLKELLENSLDAGARRITVELSGAGRKVLRVSDDGSGMDPQDCARCLERHATSKIKALSDLQALRTFGFRGEALFAAAAVSRLEITSRPAKASSAWRVRCEAGTILSSGPAPGAAGTTVEVKDLFFNTPARLKFLKSDAYEKGRLAAVVEEAALANPEVHFSTKSEGRAHLRFEGQSGGEPVAAARRRAAQVLGAQLAAGLVAITARRPGLEALMLVSPPGAMASTREFQHWFVNRRPVASRLLQQALYRATKDLRSGSLHPVCVAHLELSPDSFDVNVHPGKREIRFKSDRDIFELVSGLILANLAKAKAAASLFSSPSAEESSSFVGEPSTPYRLQTRAAPRSAAADSFLPMASGPAQALERGPDAPKWFTPPYRYLGQIERSYLVFEAAGGLFVLDQHAAAERILFEKYLRGLEDGIRPQKLMLPIPIELPASSLHKVLSRKERLSRLGFEVEPYGKTVLHVLAVPALFEKSADLKELAHRVLESLEDAGGAARDLRHDAVATIACKAAVKAHDPLGEREALRLLEDLKDCEDGSCCPHGRRAMLALNRDELARRFQRPGAPPL